MPPALDEARSTWLEILGQATSALARSLGAALGGEVVCGPGAERQPSPEARHWVAVAIEFSGESLPPLTVGFSQAPGDAIASAASLAQAEAPLPPPRAAAANRDRRSSPAMELLLDLELPVSISFGKTQMPLKDVLKLTTGSIVQLNRTADDPVEILVNQRLIARGEVVVVDGNYGIRIQELASRQDRLRSIP
jgi:flagellar motor switch protein FliN